MATFYARITDKGRPLPGELVHNGLTNWFECLSWGAQVGGLDKFRTGKSKEVTFGKFTNRTTPYIHSLVATGKIIDFVMEDIRKSAGGSEYLHLRITMKNACATAFRHGSGLANAASLLVQPPQELA